MLFQNIIKGSSLIYRISHTVRQSCVSVHRSQHWQNGWHDGDARVLVILVVPGRPCWVCAKIKWEVLGQPQANCLYYICCRLWLCSLCKNSCFLKQNESKPRGGKHKLYLRKKAKTQKPKSKGILMSELLRGWLIAGRQLYDFPPLSLGQPIHRNVCYRWNCARIHRSINIAFLF